jgi:tRNA (guanine-N7-)-methyltransferase
MSTGGAGKRHRIRAHINPLAITYFDYPRTPELAPWHDHYPAYFRATENDAQRACEPVGEKRQVTIADVGCGFGGLLVTLSPLFPEKLILGMEIRDKVVSIVDKRIKDLRATPPADGTAATAVPPYSNISVLRTNAMKHLINYFHKGQVSEKKNASLCSKSEYLKLIVECCSLKKSFFALLTRTSRRANIVVASSGIPIL